ncbi:NAD(P)-binding protein [Hesseltinella vesiculosa]|uniref:NAD(P)-binding protein n=1 Tax=Hesseltinella vesiculosa TaxID=101127 RepID=A0A1X2GV62_9FUNG|nr:NAD(P)-binding protein [Hesseltinella vesiculosa]
MGAPVVLVTGCTDGGIGHFLCKEFVAQGCRVFATARRLEAMDALEGCEKLMLDVNDSASVNACVKEVTAAAGQIDILVNNAGVPAVGTLLDIDMDVARRCMETNVFGVLAMCRAVGQQMAKRGSGKIINVGSVVGYCATPYTGIYGMSKAALHSMTDVLRLELAPFNVQVSVLAPGAVTSNFGKAAVNTVTVPETSLYKSIAQHIIDRAEMSQAPGASTPTDEFAQYVVQRVLEPYPPSYITAGAKSTMFLAFYYLPTAVKDYLLSKKLGLHDLIPTFGQ